MKTRNGFVSNSSSSSFVILGYKADDVFSDIGASKKEEIIGKHSPKLLKSESFKKYGVDEIWHDFLYETNFGIDGISYLGDDGPGYIGFVLADISSEGGDFEFIRKIPVGDIMEKIDALKKYLDIKEEPKFIIGTRSC